jgi:hypothetical protein
MGVFARIMEGLVAEGSDHKTISIDATYLKAHRTACQSKGGAWTPDQATHSVLHDRRPSERLHWGKSACE